MRYRGYYYDKETGLYYCNYRYYDPQTGRWISSDSIEYLDPKSMNGLNLYAYCGNNPVMKVDPDGHFGIIAGLIFALAVVATINDIVQLSIGANSQGLPDDKGVFVGAGDHTIANSYKILTPWVQLGYSIYLNHINEKTRDEIKG